MSESDNADPTARTAEVTDSDANRIMAFIEEKFEEMKEENDGIRRQVKKQEEKQFKFDKKAHEVQFLFNTEMLEIIESVQDGVARQKTARVKNQLEEMVKKLNYRNKLIKIADKSPFGWTTVSEYEKDRLANDADDEKRIRDSEKGAEKIEKERKAKETKDQEKSSRFHPYRGGNSRASSTITSRDQQNSRGDSSRSGNSSSSSSQGGSGPRFRNAPQPSNSHSNRYSSSQGYNQGRGNRPCFGCGEFDHVRRDCPNC